MKKKRQTGGRGDGEMGRSFSVSPRLPVSLSIDLAFLLVIFCLSALVVVAQDDDEVVRVNT